jgi:hypothetical protein
MPRFEPRFSTYRSRKWKIPRQLAESSRLPASISMKPFNYRERLRVLREGVDAEVAHYIFRAKKLTYEEIAALFSCPVDRIKSIAGKAGIVRGRGWRPKT